VLVIVAIFSIYKAVNAKAILGTDIKILTYQKGGKSTGGIINIPYIKNASVVYANVLIGSEWVIKNMPVSPTKDWSSNLTFKSSSDFSGNQSVRVVVSKKRVGDTEFNQDLKGDDFKVASVNVVLESLDEIFGAEIPDKPEESMKQGGNAPANTTVANPTGVPDFSQRKAECAPTVAANGLYSLAIKNGAADKLPENPQEMIDGLKGDMKWTFKTGVVPNDFVAGKNKWAVTHGLPIKTQTIGDRDGRGTLDEIKEALSKGAAVEMRIRFADANLKVIGGHIISVVRVREVDGNTFIDVHDPASPAGTETYKVVANSIENYPYHDGDTVIGIAFSQVWEGAPIGGQLDPMTEAEMQGIREFAGEKKTIKAIRYNNKYIPLTEIHVGKGDHCDSKEQSYPHWHSNNGSFAIATDGTRVFDNQGCGYGKTKDVPEVDVEIP
jgi:hypothetical protein